MASSATQIRSTLKREAIHKRSERKTERHIQRERETEQRPMGMSLAQAVAALMGRCARRLSRAAHRMRPRPGLASSFSSRAVVPFFAGGGVKKSLSWPASSKSKRRKTEEWSFEADDEVWRKEILMGERCQPLEFSGAIYYDAEGRRLAQPPPPRTPMRSPLPASVKLAANA